MGWLNVETGRKNYVFRMFCHSRNYGYRWCSWLGLVFICFVIFRYSLVDKFKIFAIAGVVIGIISGVRISYDDYQRKKQLEHERFELTSQIEQLQQTIARNNQIIADNEQSKRELENQSIERQERKIYVNQPIPAHLLNDCAPRLPPKSMTFGDSVKYNEHLLNVIEMCNQDKRAILIINKQQTNRRTE